MVNLCVRISPALHRRLKQCSALKNQPLTAYVVKLLEQQHTNEIFKTILKVESEAVLDLSEILTNLSCMRKDSSTQIP